MTTRVRKPGRFTVFRDLTSYIGGWLLIGYQALAVPPQDVNAWFLLLGGSLIGVPGIAEVLAFKSRTGTGGLPGSPPAEDSSAHPSSSSPGT